MNIFQSRFKGLKKKQPGKWPNRSYSSTPYALLLRTENNYDSLLKGKILYKLVKQNDDRDEWHNKDIKMIGSNQIDSIQNI